MGAKTLRGHGGGLRIWVLKRYVCTGDGDQPNYRTCTSSVVVSIPTDHASEMNHENRDNLPTNRDRQARAR